MITDRVVEEMQAWCARPLLPVYAVVFPMRAARAGIALAPVDAIYVKVRDGQVGNRPFYAAIGVDLAGHRDVLGVWAGTAGHGESAKFWMSVLSEIRNRGVNDVFFIVCDGPVGTARQCECGVPVGHGADIIYAPWGWRDGPVGCLRRRG